MPLIIGGVNVDPRFNSARAASGSGGSTWHTGDGFSGQSGSFGDGSVSGNAYADLLSGSSNSATTSAAQVNMDFSELAGAIYGANAAANAFNAAEAEKNRQFQLYMSNTAHQREMADLAAAGLNPILAARQGASTASGGQAVASDASGALAGLLGQIISAQSAQAVANRNNAAAQLLEKMRESHDLRTLGIKSVVQLLTSVFG